MSTKGGSVRRAGPVERVKRIMSAQSAFTFGDLLNLAQVEDAQTRLDRIYEWYFSRTTTAIRVAYAAAVATAAAIYGLVLNGNSMASHDSTHSHHGIASHDAMPTIFPDHMLSRGLTAITIACVVAGLFQRRELAQLHSEFAAASGLLAELQCKDAVVRPAPTARALTRRDNGSSWTPTVLFGVGVLAAIVAIVCADTPVHALEALVIAVAALAVGHLAAEWRSSRRFEWDTTQPTSSTDVSERSADEPKPSTTGPMTALDASKQAAEASPLVIEIGHYLLEEYALDADVANKVDVAIARAKSAVGASQAIPRPRADTERADAKPADTKPADSEKRP